MPIQDLAKIDISKLPDQPEREAPQPAPQTYDLSKIDLSSLPDQPKGKEEPFVGPKESDATPPAPSLMERLGGKSGLAAMGLRMGSGILAAGGGPTGAIRAGLGEIGAEAIEGKGAPVTSSSLGYPSGQTLASHPTLGMIQAFLSGALHPSPSSAARAATAAGIGAIPIASTIVGGKPLVSALRSGALAGGGTAATELASGQKLDPGAIGTSAGIGALVGGAFGGFQAAKDLPPRAPDAIVEPTAYEGGSVLNSKGKPVVSHGPPPIPGGRPTVPAPTLEPVPPEAEKYAYRIPYGSAAQDVAAASPSTRKVMAQEIRDARAAARVATQAAKDADKQKLADLAAARVATARTQAEAAGLEPQAPSYSESASTPLPEGGRGSTTQRWALPKEDAGLGAVNEARYQQIVNEVLGGEGKAGAPPQPRVDEAVNAPVTAPEPNPAPIPKEATPLAKTLGVEAPNLGNAEPTTSEPSTPLAKFFKTPRGAAGMNYRLAQKAEAAGEIPTSKYARDAVLRENATSKATAPPVGEVPQAAALDQQMAERGGSPPQGEPASTNPENPNFVAGLAQAAKRSKDPATGRFIQRIVDLATQERGGGGTGEAGGIAPAAMRGLMGATVGAPLGAYLYPDDPLKGAAALSAMGGIIGSGGANEALQWRNAGMLFGPAVVKKHFSDVGAVLGEAGERAFKQPGTTVKLLKELLRVPTNARNYLTAFKNPEIARDVIGETSALSEAVHPTTAGLGNVVRGFSAPQYATTEIYRRAGIPIEEALRALNMADPQTAAGKMWVKGQNIPYVNALRPFVRYATNLAEGGLQRMPGVSYAASLAQKFAPENKALEFLAGPAETRLGRTLIGTGAFGAGMYQGAQEGEQAAQGEKPEAPIYQQAAWARYLPTYTLGRWFGGSPLAQREFRKIYVPSIGTSIPEASPKDTPSSYAGKALDTVLGQVLWDWLNPAADTEKQSIR